MWLAGAIRPGSVVGALDRHRVGVANQIVAAACLMPIPKSFALLTPRLIGGVTSPGDAVVPAQTTPMRAIAAKLGLGSGGFLRDGPNASPQCLAPVSTRRIERTLMPHCR